MYGFQPSDSLESNPRFRADEDTASEYLKDLISSAGLKDAWGEMAKKFRSVPGAPLDYSSQRVQVPNI